MKLRILTTSLFLLALTSSFSQVTDAPAFGKGLFNLVGKDSTFTMKIATRMQFLGVASWQKEEGGGLINPESNYLVRRSRLKFDGFVYSPKLEYKLELGLSNRDMSGGSDLTSGSPRYIMDAVVMWNFYENFELWVGQTKLPGNVERVISSANLQLVDRSLVNSRFNIDRDMGIQLRHKTNLFGNVVMREKFAISQGEGRNVTGDNLGGYQYTSRLELLPFGEFKGDYTGADLERETSPKLMLAATYDINHNAVRNRSNLGSYMEIDNGTGFYETTINTLFVDAMFKYNGFSFMGEYAYRDANDPLAKNSDGTLTGDIVQVGDGLNLQMGYLLKNDWEVSGRYTNIKLDENITGKSPEDQYTLGLSKYIVGHKLKVQTDISYLNVDGGTDEVMYRLQMDVHF